MAFSYGSWAQPQGYNADLGQLGAGIGNIIKEKQAQAAIGDYAKSLYMSGQGQGQQQAQAGAAQQSAPAASALQQFGLPDQQTLMGLLQNPQTRQQGLGLIEQARSAYEEANDPLKKLQLQKAQYEVAHQGDGPVDTTSRDANTRFKLGREQGLTGDALKTYTLTGKLPADASGAGDETWGLTPQPYRMQDGSVQIGVLSNQGNFKPVQLPEGAQAAFPVQQLNTGTGFTEASKFGGTTGGQIAIDNEGEARDKAIGTAAGQNAAAAPASIATADQMLSQIDGVLNDPNLGYAIGVGGVLPAVPNTPQAGTVARIDQLGGGAFLAAYNQLRGGGAISEVEGRKATEAIARLSRVQNEDDFRRALNDLKGVVEAAKARAQKQASSGASNTTSGGVNWSVE